MDKITDEILMAYVDGELGEKQADDIRAAIEADPNLHERIEKFQDSMTMLQGLYDAPLHEPVPERLLQAARGTKTETVTSSASKNPEESNVVSRFFNLFHLPSLQPAYAMAAICILVIGIGTGHLLTNRKQPKQYSFFLHSNTFNQGLEKTVSGQSFYLNDRHVKITPVSTFVDKTQRYCRQYEVVMESVDNTQISLGIAFRDTSGIWKTMLYTTNQMSHGLSIDNQDNYLPAGADDVISDFISKLMTSPPMGLGQETKLIAQNWAPLTEK